MFVELPQNLIMMTGGAFLLGWLLSYISSKLGSKYRAMKRDPRDKRIRSLEADLRVAETHRAKSLEEVEKMEDHLKETTVGLERRDNVISEQQSKIETISRDLKESVQKTRELRTEVADRATENVHAEAKIREVETELSVAHASKDMISTGVLDYQMSPDDEEADDTDRNDRQRGISKAST
ncbi:MAG: hypothetical protein GY783_13905 [Gammaproteobacteria bacterium]|nr:hypothetical protein [Gammaproteobacteria bacterium]